MKNFINNITHGNLIDVVVSGYINAESPPVFHPMNERIYFITNDVIFELYIDDGIILCNKLKSISTWFDLDEDDRFSLMSIYSQVFKTEQDVKITQVNYRENPFSTIEFNYNDGGGEKQFFLDPNNFFGFTYYP